MKTEILATVIMANIALIGFEVVYAQVLNRDVGAPTPGLNGTASTEPSAGSIDISPLELLPTNGTVTMSLEDIVDTNMNEIPPQGVTVIISNEAVTVTNHEVTIEEPELEPEESQAPIEESAAPEDGEDTAEDQGAEGDEGEGGLN
ncbi:MAG: hypothetical protein ACRD5E_14085 [Nitrososphaeraceae archaeon]